MIHFHQKKWTAVWGLCLLVPAFPIFAQQNKYTLKELLDSAQNYQPVLMQRSALVEAAKAQITDLKRSFLPQVRISDQIALGTDNSIAGSYLPLGFTPSTSGGIRSSNNFSPTSGNTLSIYGDYEVYNFGFNDARVASAQTFVDLQKADLQRDRYVIQLNIARLYFDIQKRIYQLNADRQNIDRYQNIFGVIRALAASGLKPGSDSSLAKAELSIRRCAIQAGQ